MPRANPESSFESAARHLFRHIGDLNALRRNPLVHSLVDAADARSDVAVLREMHRAIIAAISKSSGGAPRSAARAHRRQQIVIALCAGETSTKTAARLRISIHHYYRERRAAAALVANFLLEDIFARSKRWEIADPLKLLCMRTAALREQGLAKAAVSLLEAEIPRSPDVAVRTVLESELARSLESLGRVDLASALLGDQQRDDLPTSADSTAQWAREHRTLTRALLAKDLGDTGAGELLESLAVSKLRSERVDEEALDAVLECGAWYCQVGAFDKGRTMLNHAREFVRRMNHIPVRQQCGLALLGSVCALQIEDEFDLEYQWLNEAWALSASNNSLESLVQATAGLMHYYVAAGYEEGAYRLAQDGLRIAQDVDGTRLVAQFAVKAAGILLKTRYWRAIDPLIFEVEEFMRPASVGWVYLKEFQGLFLMRTSHYGRASQLFSEVHESGRKMNNRWLEGVALRNLASARYSSGSVGEAREIMRAALALLEGCSGIVSLCTTYEAAACVLADRRLARLAVRLKEQLSARAANLRRPSGCQTKIGVGPLRKALPITGAALTIGSRPL